MESARTSAHEDSITRRRMKKIIHALPDYEFVMHHPIGTDEYAVLLKQGSVYSVCRMQPRRMIAMSPNYQADGHGILSGPLSREGLHDLLQWTCYETATVRFRKMSNLPGNVISLLPDRKHSG